MHLSASLGLLALVLQVGGPASLPGKWGEQSEGQPRGGGDSNAVLHPGNATLSPDGYDELIDLSDYWDQVPIDLSDDWDQVPEVKGTSRAPPIGIRSTHSPMAPRTRSPDPTVTRPGMLDPPVSPTSHSLPTCLLCVCLGSSVYCDDADLESIPPLPRTTAYLYARSNRVRRVRAGDFGGLTKLRRIDLSGNLISAIDEDALRPLPALRDLLLPGNRLAALPRLPPGVEVLDVRQNRLQSAGIPPGAFGDLENLQSLYLADNLLEAVPGPLPPSLRSLHLQNNVIATLQRDAFCDTEGHRHTRRPLEDIRLDGNPVNLGLFPGAYFCLPRLPTGRFS